MEIGIAAFCTDQTIGPTRLAQEVESHGFDSLFVTEHTHIPISRDTSVPYVYGGGSLQDFYKRTFDPFVALTAAAISTERIRLGTGICLLAQRDMIITAKEVATLDHLSNGRFVFGIGFGWIREEAENHGVVFSERQKLVREKILAMKALWTEEVASFRGELIQLEECWMWPKPKQSPYPPIYVGGSGPSAMRHAAEWADVWFPTPHPDDRTLEKAIPRFRAMVEESGRDPDSVGVAVSSAPDDVGVLDRYREQGVRAAILRFGQKPTDEALRSLDELSESVLEPMR